MCLKSQQSINRIGEVDFVDISHLRSSLRDLYHISSLCFQPNYQCPSHIQYPAWRNRSPHKLQFMSPSITRKVTLFKTQKFKATTKKPI